MDIFNIIPPRMYPAVVFTENSDYASIWIFGGIFNPYETYSLCNVVQRLYLKKKN